MSWVELNALWIETPNLSNEYGDATSQLEAWWIKTAAGNLAKAPNWQPDRFENNNNQPLLDVQRWVQELCKFNPDRLVLNNMIMALKTNPGLAVWLKWFKIDNPLELNNFNKNAPWINAKLWQHITYAQLKIALKI